ncbi:MAG: TonB-dependent receptor [Proteobacteria bacterium]|nr:TonB-dependent receptor [Pseudomonadota bacterium]
MLLGIATLSVAFTQQAVAQDADADADKYGEIEEVVATGTRGQPRSVTESMVPVDVISADEFINQGGTDLSDLIRNVVPSYSVNTQPISDAATVVRPAQLRGMAPDQTLVLINGKRRHRAAVISWLGNGVADGAQGPDISVIPSIALKQVEVLRDGASAQYGSDAIAGVMNFILKDAREGGSLEVRYGEFYEGDGTAMQIAANIGLPVGDEGFVNISVEYGESDPTDRSLQRDDAAALIAAGNTFVANPAQIWGSPIIDDELKLMVNFATEAGNGKEFYGHGNYAEKRVEGGFFFRNPNTRGAVFSADGGISRLVGDMTPGDGITCPGGIDFSFDSDPVAPGIQPGIPPGTELIIGSAGEAAAVAQITADPNCFIMNELFPGGFTPRFGGEVLDFSIVGGIRGETSSGLLWDASIGYGTNEVDFFINNTVNASLGPATPTSFDPGLYRQEEFNLNFDVSYAFGDNGNIAGGLEYRDEQFDIGLGQTESWSIGPLADQGFSAASNGFPGFSPIAAGTWSRSNFAVYVDLEVNPTDDWSLGFATRFEDFDDFGTTFNGKVATNFRINDRLAWRASASSGFRAPTPGQSNAFNVSTEFDLVLMDLVNNGNIPPGSRVAELRGGRPLEAEKSINLSVGAILTLGEVDITIDYFNIELKDRLGQTKLFALTAQEVIDLLAEGVTSAANLANFRFFINDFETTTQGIDLIANYTADMLGGSTDWTLLFNWTDTEVTKHNPDTLDDLRIQELQEGLPGFRGNLTANHRATDNFRVLARLSYYDEWFDSEDGAVYDGEWLVDLEAAYSVNDNLTVTVGAQNIFDIFPGENQGARSGVGNRYSQFTPFGFNGGFWYARIRYEL